MTIIKKKVYHVTSLLKSVLTLQNVSLLQLLCGWSLAQASKKRKLFTLFLRAGMDLIILQARAEKNPKLSTLKMLFFVYTFCC